MIDTDKASFTQRHGLVICFLLLVVFTTALKLPSLKVAHREYDERIYVTLAKKVWNGGDYSLRDTPLLEELTPEMYDRPLFFQPPLFVLLSIPLVLSFGDNAPVVLSWAGHVLVLLTLLLFLRRLLPDRPLLIVLLLLLAATDPILFFASKKIWIDPLAAGFGSLSLYLFWRACVHDDGRRRIATLVLSGVLLGAAVLTKVPSVLLGPCFAFLYLGRFARQPIRKQAPLLLAVLGPALAISLPWFVITFLEYGKLIDTPILTEELIRTNDYIRMVVDRPWYYYPKEIVLLTPVILLPLARLLFRPSRLSFLAAALWIALLSVIAGYTAFAVIYHQSYVMRYLALIGLPFYLLLGLCLEGRTDRGIEGNLLTYTFLFTALVVNAMTCFFFIEHFYADELFSLYEMLTQIR